MFVEFIKDWRRRSRLGRHFSRQLRRHGAARGRVKVLARAGEWHVADLEKARHLTVRLASSAEWDAEQRYRLPPALHVFSLTAPSVKAALVNLHDLEVGMTSAHFSFSSNAPNAILIPDADFYCFDAYQDLRGELGGQRPWRDRGNTIFWRGSTTGIGALSNANGDYGGDYGAANILPRIRMCALLKSIPGVDAKIYSCVQSDKAAEHEASLRQAGLFGDKRPMQDWLDDKYAIDIDGNGNAWSNFFTRLLMGCCVIKVASPTGYRQWYYDRLEPWKHFVPARADLSDLADTIEWCRTHESDCALIASAGRDFAHAMTLETEMQDAARRIDEKLG